MEETTSQDTLATGQCFSIRKEENDLQVTLIVQESDHL